MSRESKILAAILVAVVGGMIGLFVIANNNSSEPPPPVGDKTKVIRDNSHKQGTGPVQIVEFGDYQCPACGQAHPIMQRLMKEYEGKVTFYFRNFPLASSHKNAMISAQAAEAAGDQGKFWEMHDKLYEAQNDWSNDASPINKFTDYAKALGLDTEKFKKALEDDQFKGIVDQDFADGTALSVQSTPSFFINGTLHKGSFQYEVLRDAVEAELKKQPVSSATPAPSPPVQ